MNAARSSAPPPLQTGAGATGLRSLLLAGLCYAEARLKLAQEEGRDLLGLGLKLAAAVLGAVFFLTTAYLLALLALVDWVAEHWWAGALAPAAMTVAAGHLLLAGALALWSCHATRGRTFFHATRREYELDKQWLRSTTRKSSD